MESARNEVDGTTFFWTGNGTCSPWIVKVSCRESATCANETRENVTCGTCERPSGTWSVLSSWESGSYLGSCPVIVRRGRPNDYVLELCDRSSGAVLVLGPSWEKGPGR